MTDWKAPESINVLFTAERPYVGVPQGCKLPAKGEQSFIDYVPAAARDAAITERDEAREALRRIAEISDDGSVGALQLGAIAREALAKHRGERKYG